MYLCSLSTLTVGPALTLGTRVGPFRVELACRLGDQDLALRPQLLAWGAGDSWTMGSVGFRTGGPVWPPSSERAAYQHVAPSLRVEDLLHPTQPCHPRG